MSRIAWMVVVLSGCPGAALTGEFVLRNEDSTFTTARASFSDGDERVTLPSGDVTVSHGGDTVVMNETIRLGQVNYLHSLEDLPPDDAVTFAAADADLEATVELPQPFDLTVGDPITDRFVLSWTPSGTGDAMWATFAGDCSSLEGTLTDLGTDDGEETVVIADLAEFRSGRCETRVEVWRERAGTASAGSVAYGQQVRIIDVVVDP